MSKKSKRKNDLRSSILILLLLLLLLISATYAWFTANETVTVSTLNVHIDTKSGLQISTDAETWKSIITSEDIISKAYTGNSNQLPEELTAVSTVGEIDASTGFMKMYLGKVTADETDGLDKLTATLETGESDREAGNYMAFDLFLKVDKDTNLQLTDASNVIMKIGSTDKGIKQSTRIAFCVEGRKDVGAAVSDITSLKSAVSFLDEQGAKNPAKTVYIWEPNSNLHTPAASAHANSNYGIKNLATDGTANALQYYGIKREITTGLTLKGTNDGTDTNNFALIAPDYVTKDVMTTTDVFTLQAGITKVRVYMWIEGQDVDCENTASGTDITFNVQLQVKPENNG